MAAGVAGPTRRNRPGPGRIALSGERQHHRDPGHPQTTDAFTPVAAPLLPDCGGIMKLFMVRHAQTDQLQAIGYWRSDNCLLSFPHPRELIDPEWDTDERAAVADYLSRGVPLRGYFGYSHCR